MNKRIDLAEWTMDSLLVKVSVLNKHSSKLFVFVFGSKMTNKKLIQNCFMSSFE